jgi:hypothetical protein
MTHVSHAKSADPYVSAWGNSQITGHVALGNIGGIDTFVTPVQTWSFPIALNLEDFDTSLESITGESITTITNPSGNGSGTFDYGLAVENT